MTYRPGMLANWTLSGEYCVSFLIQMIEKSEQTGHLKWIAMIQRNVGFMLITNRTPDSATSPDYYE